MRRGPATATWTVSNSEAQEADRPETVSALVLVWSRDEPERVGEVALVPGGFTGVTVRMGRAPAEPTDPLPRVEFARQRPGQSLATGPLTSPRISRDQLQIEANRGGSLRVVNIGRCPMLHNGEVVEEAEVVAGDLLELKGQVLLLCLNRRPSLAPFSPGTPAPPVHRFGQADALGMVGESPVVWALREQIQFVAPRAAHVLIRGASGTGKELVAQAIHSLSRRSRKTMVSRNAATIPETLIDAELFGNARNYPNPGMLERAGLVGEADGSTLFLDEFAEIPPAMQAHLLRVLDQGEYHRLGESKPRTSDFRLIAATNRPESALKEDVLARLRIRVEVPDLNQRREDIPLIARHLLRRIVRDDPQLMSRCFVDGPDSAPRLTPALVGALLQRSWTTHIRELESLLWRSISESRGEALEPFEGLNVSAPVVQVPHTTLDLDAKPAVDPMSLSPEAIQAVLDRHGGRQEPAWKELGFSSRHVLTRLVRRYNLRVRGRGSDDEERP